MITYEPFEEGHVAGVLALSAELEWPSYTANAETTRRALAAPGSVTLVACDGEHVVGVAQIFGDGRIQAVLALLGVSPGARRRGIARRLVEEAFARAGGKWLDLVSEPGAEVFYRSFAHQERAGFRLYPDPPDAEPPPPSGSSTSSSSTPSGSRT